MMSSSEPPTKKQKQTDEAETNDGDSNSTPHHIEQPTELVSRVREDIVKELERSANNDVGVYYDINHSIREIRAIISTNEEIFSRSLKSISIKSNDRATHQTVMLISYPIVGSHTYDAATLFVTYPERSERTFDVEPLMNLPTELSRILSFEYKEGTTFIDYASFFEKSLVLHDGVLGPFLAKLKNHLMNVQVCLGNIESWAMESYDNIDYLESTFGVKLEIPNYFDSMIRKCDCPPGTHPDHLKCSDCSIPFCQHGIGFSVYPKQCPDRKSRSGYGGSGVGGSGFGTQFFHCKKFQVLKRCTNNVPGKIETTFTISSEDDRKRLQKLLEFMES